MTSTNIVRTTPFGFPKGAEFRACHRIFGSNHELPKATEANYPDATGALAFASRVCQPARNDSPTPPQNNSGMLWNAIRVGADLYAVSIVAGASVLMPYLLLS
jgi:hypothetical protein